MKNYVLHLNAPAGNWELASPVGCGSAGAMIYGWVNEERLCYNEESIWAGEKTDTIVKGYDEKIKHLREMFLHGNEYEAQMWAENNMDGCFLRVKSYEYAGKVCFTFHEDDEKENYARDIDLINGICTVSYTKNGVDYKREYFSSYPTRLTCSRFTASDKFAVSIRYTRENIDSLTYRPDGIDVVCHTAEGTNTFAFRMKIKTDGTASVNSGSVDIKDATFVETYTGIYTSFKYDDIRNAADQGMKAAERPWDSLKAEHVADHSALMLRSDISFEEDESIDNLSATERLERLRSNPDAKDGGLMSIYYQFGKYLLIGSSRQGTLPANLQGVWANGLTPPWCSDYHTNINLQMNYWQAEEANISECCDALFDYMNRYLLPDGEKVAHENYRTRGLVVHHLSDIYGFAAVADGPWGMWALGGAWLAFHLWEHYLYTEDKEWLRNVAYRYIRDCADFAVDNLFEGGDGYLYSGPSTSPENSYVIDYNGERKNILMTVSPAMDIEILGELLDFYVKTEEILGIDPANAENAAEKRARMLPLRVGKNGQLMEWYKDYDESEVGHRHISHGFGLYPGTVINCNTPELFEAMKVTLDRRINGEGWHPGWSWAWLSNLEARLEDKDGAYAMLRRLFTDKTLPNLLDTHSPFQIDGNFGGAAAIGEMVMQSHLGVISIIPALPAMLSGSFTGLRARGGVTVSAEWQEGSVTRVVLKADKPCTVTLRVPNHVDESISLDTNEKIIRY